MKKSPYNCVVFHPLKIPSKNQGFLYCSCGAIHLTGSCPFNAKKVAVGRLGGRPFPFLGMMEKKNATIFWRDFLNALVLLEAYITSESLIEQTAEKIKDRISPKKNDGSLKIRTE